MKAWIENGIIRDIAHAEPTAIYHPDIAKLYTVEVPNDSENGDTFENGILTKKPVIEVAPVEPVAPKTTTLSPIEFKLRFTAPERVAVYQSTDLIVKDFVSLLDDVRLTKVDLALQANIDALGYLAEKSLIAPERIAEILG